MTIGRDGQPDILCGGDPLLHGLHRWRARADWLTRNIAIELAAIRNPLSSPRRKAGARGWIFQAQNERRRALHNEGSEVLRERLDGKVALDFDTARRLFTLICVLHIKG